MLGAGEPSKLCQDIFELEKDFRYNLFLLKVRDTEIARCKTQTENLLHDLKQKEQDNCTIRIKLRDLESELKSANIEKARMKISYEETIASLSDSLAELRKTHENYQRDQRNQEKKREAELEERWKQVVESKEKQKQREMAEMNDRLNREMCLTQKLKTQLQEIITENISLRNEFQEKQSSYISKISIFESELRSSQEEKVNLEMKLDASKKDCAYFEAELRKTITEKDQVKQELSASDESRRNSERKLNEISAEKDNLNHQLNTTTLELRTCLTELERTKEERDKLEVEFEYCKRVAEEEKCTKPEHENIDTVLKQNSVLQEVVKAMRRERTEAVDTNEMDRKLQRLEELVHCLKTSMLNHLKDGNNIDAPHILFSN